MTSSPNSSPTPTAQNFHPVTAAGPSASSSSPGTAPPIVLQWLPNSSASSTYSHDSFTSGLEAGNSSDYDSQEFDVESYEIELSSIVMRHEFENGRRFHKFRHGRYPLPNDDAEQERDALKHALLLEVTEGHLFQSQLIHPPQRIIDLGCGTGRWAIDVAETFPAAEVIGVDLSPIMPEWLPPNVRFMVDDIEDEQWLHGGGFDLVYLRHVFAFLRSPETVLRNSFEHLAPGGFVECTEFHGYLECSDGTMPDDHPPKRFLELIAQGMTEFGSKWTIGKDLMPYLEAAGFENIKQKTIKIPIGRWAKTRHHRLLGLYMIEVLDALFESAKARALTRLGIPQNELDRLTAEAIEGLNNYKRHAYISLSFFSGQKPV